MTYDRERFVRFLAIALQSEHDGEIVNAVRMAARLLAAAKVSPQDALGATPAAARVEPNTWQQQARPRPWEEAQRQAWASQQNAYNPYGPNAYADLRQQQARAEANQRELDEALEALHEALSKKPSGAPPKSKKGWW